jgi:hypothetical protein
LTNSHTISQQDNISLSNHLVKAEKHFKINSSKELKNVVIDQSSFLSFPPNTVLSDTPPGIYYPTQTRYEDFVLSKFSKSIPIEDHVDDVMSEMLQAIGEEPSNEYTASVLKWKQIKTHNKARYLGDGYFPLHRYNSVLSDVHTGVIEFLNNKEFYSRSNLGFKRSILLYGPPGTGKSRYLDWLSKELISVLDAIIIRINSVNDAQLLNDHGLLTLSRVLNNRLLVLLIEELSSITSSRAGHLSLLNILDSPMLRENVLVLSTTNKPAHIPDNVVRNQRIDVLAEISPENNEPDFPRAFYSFVFQRSLEPKYEASEWYNQPMTPADLKELFIYSKIHDIDLDESFESIKQRNEKIKNSFESTRFMGF